MGSLYYDLVSILQGGGCQVKVGSINAGWERRSRSSGGFSNPPLGVWWHHTASSSSVEGDLNWMINNCPDEPVGNMLLDRDGIFWPIAGGASNCAGKGGPWNFSRGTCPLDSGNTYGFQIEVANNGVGEAWPQVQIDAYILGSNALNAHVGNRFDDIVGHAHYAPTRKIDPATADAVRGPWQPRSINSSGTWNLDDMKAICLERAGQSPIPTPTPPTPLKGDKLYVLLIQNGDPQGRTFLSDLTQKTYIPSQEALGALKVTLGSNGLDQEVHYVNPNQMAGYGLLTAPVPGLDEYGAMT